MYVFFVGLLVFRGRVRRSGVFYSRVVFVVERGRGSRVVSG